MTKQAIIFGATGAVGRQLLNLCLDGDHYETVTVIARRAAPATHSKLNWIKAGFDDLSHMDAVADLTDGDAYCCLGTTIKVAGSKDAFRQVDYAYVVTAAKFAKQCGVKSFGLVSAIGADASSSNFYSQVKGETEAAIIAEQFSTLRIFRPSLLQGKREGFRLGEEIGNVISFLLTPLFFLGLRKYQPIKIDTLARGIYQATNEDCGTDTLRIYESDELQGY